MPVALAGMPFKTTGQRGSDFKTAPWVELVPSMSNKEAFFTVIVIQAQARILYLTESTKDRGIKGQQIAR